MRDKTYNHANVSGTGFTFYNRKSTYAIDGVGVLSQKLSKVEGTQENYYDQLGYNYFLGTRKCSGKTQFGIGHKVNSTGIFTSDLGYQTIPNVISTNAFVEYYQFKPNKLFREGNQSTSINYNTHYLTKKATDFSIDYRAFASLLSYNAIFGGGGITPLVTRDYNEPRVEGRYSKSLRYFYLYAGFSSDYRKKIAVDFSQNISNFLDYFKTEGYKSDITIRYRATDKLTLKYSFAFDYDPFNFGFADIDSSGAVIYGGRKLHTYINRFEINYIFKKDMTLRLVGRHYWQTGVYREYFTILEDGSFTPNDSYSGNNDFNFNAFNVDFVYSWIFAPGSTLSVVYKNAIDSDESIVQTRFSTNFSNTLNSPQTNSLSLKVLYYLDYLYLKRKTGNT